MTTTATQALIFDMDGTIVDSMPTHGESWVVFCQRHSVTMGLAEIMRRTTGRNGVECMRELFGQQLSEDDGLRLIGEKEIIYRDLYAPKFAEVRGFTPFATLARAKGLKIGVGTAGDKHNIEFVMSRLKLPTAPDAIVGGDEGLAGKPDPAIFLEAAKRLGISAKASIVFEDAPFGIEAAHRAGMRAVALCTTHSAAELAGPHVIAAVADYTELLETHFLEKLNALPA